MENGFQCSSEGTCLVAGTMVKMADGTEKMIEHLVVGDELESYDIATLDKDNESLEYVKNWNVAELQHAPVTAKIKSIEEFPVVGIYDFNSGALQSTADHAHFVYSDGAYRFKQSRDVAVGDALVKVDGTTEEITSIEVLMIKRPVYKIDVEEYDVYCGNGYITHNPIIKGDQPVIP
ncbi:Hint domain-containing protein [Pontibacter aydingkolensis]|nr:Hint domain-containing protein [Pontibacter aydingkolensis]